MANVAWSIEVELDDKSINESTIDGLMSFMGDVHPAVGQAPSGNMSIRVMVDAPTAYRAFDMGASIVRHAARENGVVDTIVGVHLETEAELDRRLQTNDGVPMNN